MYINKRIGQYRRAAPGLSRRYGVQEKQKWISPIKMIL
jgi:hypothetical protein